MPGRVVRGMVIDVGLDPTLGKEIQKTRPCLVIQNNIGNSNSKLTIVAALTSAENVRNPPPIWVFVPRGEAGIEKDSYILCHQIRTVDEVRLGKIHGQVGNTIMRLVDQALRISLSL